MADRQDYYEVLGVEHSATADDIKRAYRRLAMRCHPDRTGDDPAAEEEFKRANDAYEVLSDATKRAHYDVIGRRPTGEVILNGGATMEDVFATMAGAWGVRGAHYTTIIVEDLDTPLSPVGSGPWLGRRCRFDTMALDLGEAGIYHTATKKDRGGDSDRLRFRFQDGEQFYGRPSPFVSDAVLVWRPRTRVPPRILHAFDTLGYDNPGVADRPRWRSSRTAWVAHIVMPTDGEGGYFLKLSEGGAYPISHIANTEVHVRGTGTPLMRYQMRIHTSKEYVLLWADEVETYHPGFFQACIRAFDVGAANKLGPIPAYIWRAFE